MPTILMFDGLRAVIYLNDHRPGHIHVMGQGCEARFELLDLCSLAPASTSTAAAAAADPCVSRHASAHALALRENHYFTHARLCRIAELLAEQVPRLVADWRALHGRH